jgi:AraC-like DNA-binding protein
MADQIVAGTVPDGTVPDGTVPDGTVVDGIGLDSVAAPPAPSIRHLVSGYVGSHLRGFRPGLHRGLPTHHLGLIISFDEPIRFAATPGPPRSPAIFQALVHGLQTGPAMIAHSGTSYTLSVDLTPAGARRLLGLPAAALAGTIVSLDDVLGPAAAALLDRLAAAPGWNSRFAVLDEVLTRRATVDTQADPPLADVWRRLVGSGGALAIRELAAESGYSRQHLTRRFVAEHGRTPKQVARLVRFGRSHRMLRKVGRHQSAGGRMSLAEVAARCGYFDQAHLAREWNDLAGCPPSVWLASEQLPFVQEPAATTLAGSSL